MAVDLDPILDGWDFHPDRVTVRTIQAEDGEEKIQLRLDMGVLQMEVDGRPDGKRIQGEKSWFDLHVRRQQEHDAANPDEAPYQLGSEDCSELMREGVQFYHRYISFWELQRYELCARDTTRNLRLFRFVRDHARYDRDKLQFDQWRPYVTMMHTRAVATPLIDLKQWEAAITAIDAGVKGLEEFLADYGQEDQSGRMSELLFLRRWRREVVQLAGKADSSVDANGASEDPMNELRERLESAVQEERYEDAARVRDELNRLENPPPPGGLGGSPA